MTVDAVYGVHWGDEGKGKIIDTMIEQGNYSVVARWNGGDNAGHTIVTEQFGKVALHLIPSGILHKGVINVMGNGEVINLQSLVDEIEMLRGKGVEVTPERLLLSDRSHLILPYYKDVEKSKEETRKIGTTGRGIGVTYMMKSDRVGVRVVDLLDGGTKFVEKVKIHAEEHKIEVDPHKLLESQRNLLKELERSLKIGDTVDFFSRRRGADVLLEGAQGLLLDVDAGTYPYVTSSNASPNGAYIGCMGIPRIDRVIGVMKAAYITRVGGGPFPTELGTELSIADARNGKEILTDSDTTKVKEGDSTTIGKFLRINGGEYGTTTGRPRRTGWQDIVATKYSLDVAGRPNDFSSMIVLTKLDVADGLDNLKVCTGYGVDGTVLSRFPTDTARLERVEPVYEHLTGWGETRGLRSERDLPQNTRNYIRFLESRLGVHVAMISTGPDRNDIMDMGYNGY